MYTFINTIFKISLLIVIPFNVLAQDIQESISYNNEKGIYNIRYWSIVDSTYYEIPFFPGDKIKPYLKNEINYVDGTSSYRYNYFIENSKESKRELYVLFIPIDLPFKDIKIPNPNWTGNFIKKFKGIRWVNSKNRSDTLGVLPGRSVKGEFAFSSEGLPGIIESKISSYVNLGNAPDEGPTGKIRAKIDSLMDATKAYSVQTVGPTIIPENTNNQILMNLLENYLQRSCEELNWITNKGICNSLEVKLKNVQKHLENEKPKQAGNVLQAFINEVNAQKGKALSSEAYALLYFNGEYLLNKIEEDNEK